MSKEEKIVFCKNCRAGKKIRTCWWAMTAGMMPPCTA